jgi:hypothetical protein
MPRLREAEKLANPHRVSFASPSTTHQEAAMTGFDAFWAAWPSNKGGYARKGGKAECLKLWITRHHESQTETIIAHVRWLKTTADWLKESGSYIPAPVVYLRQQRWDGADIPEPIENKRSIDDSYQRQLQASIESFNRMCGK